MNQVIHTAADMVFLEWEMTGGGMLPVYTIIRLLQSGKIEALVTNSWMHHQVTNEVGTYAMQLGNEEIAELLAQLEINDAFQHPATYGKLYADSGEHQLKISRDDRDVAIRWNPNEGDQLPEPLNAVRKELIQLFNRVQTFPRQTVGCTITVGKETVNNSVGYRLRVEFKNTGIDGIKIMQRNRYTESGPYLSYCILPGDILPHNSSTYTGITRNGKRIELTAVLAFDKDEGVFRLDAGASVFFDITDEIFVIPEQSYQVVALASFTAGLEWAGQLLEVDCTCIIPAQKIG